MKRALVLSILPFAFATVGWSAVVTNFQTFVVEPESAWASVEAQTNFPVSNSDLINQGSPFLSSWEGVGYERCTIDSYGELSALIDGGGGEVPAFQPTPGGVLDIVDGKWSLVVNLNTAIAPNGYDIARIETFAGTGWGNRKSQAYTLLVSRVGETSFEAIGNFERSLFNWNGGSTVLTISDSEGVIASGVDAIRWDVYTAKRDPSVNPLNQPYEIDQGLVAVPPTEYESVYREFDVYGSPSVVPVPEPSALAVWSILESPASH